MLGVGGMPALILGLSVLFMKESPRWLITQNRRAEAESILALTSDDADEVRARVDEIQEMMEMERAGNAMTWRQLLCPRGKGMRRMITIALGINLFQQATGIEAAVYFTPTTLKKAGITADKDLLAATVGVGLAKLLFIIVAAPLLD